MLLSLPIIVEDLCDDFECPLLFKGTDCNGTYDCPRKNIMGIDIFMVSGDDAMYVATLSLTRH